MTAVTPAAWAWRRASDSGRLASTVTARRATAAAVTLGSFSMTRLRLMALVAPRLSRTAMNSQYAPKPLRGAVIADDDRCGGYHVAGVRSHPSAGIAVTGDLPDSRGERCAAVERQAGQQVQDAERDVHPRDREEEEPGRGVGIDMRIADPGDPADHDVHQRAGDGDEEAARRRLRLRAELGDAHEPVHGDGIDLELEALRHQGVAQLVQHDADHQDQRVGEPQGVAVGVGDARDAFLGQGGETRGEQHDDQDREGREVDRDPVHRQQAYPPTRHGARRRGLLTGHRVDGVRRGPERGPTVR